MKRSVRSVGLLSFVASLLLAPAALAQNRGFTLERFEPTPAGQWTFAVDHPWYSRSLNFYAAGVTFDYSHDPLVFGVSSGGNLVQTRAAIANQLALHVDFAASFLDRFAATFSLPVILYENGSTIAGVGPKSGSVGDPRVGFMVRAWGRPLEDVFSVSAGVDLWIPVGQNDRHSGDDSVRVEPKVVLSGIALKHIFWSGLVGFQYRPNASIGNLPSGSGNTVGSELRLGAALGYIDLERRFSVGPELVFATVATGPAAFTHDGTSLELLAGAHYNIIHRIDVGLAAGLGILQEPGTPDARVIARIAYSPMRPEPKRAPAPEPVRVSDRDEDGIDDAHDLCPDVARGPHPDPDRRGCPLTDRDGDGIYDKDDACPEVAAGPHPMSDKSGCPDRDSDGDGVFDSADQCVDTPAGLHPDPNKPGCPLPDRDGDSIVDADDACPDKPGAPSADPQKNGCPGLIEIKNGQIVILKPVYFASDKDVILAESFPVLSAVASALSAETGIKRLSIEGHTDASGKPDHNLQLSERRAESVKRFLIEKGVSADRLEAHGFGQTRPIGPNRTPAERATNRRVEFHIVTIP